jgi:hypothetical protein
MLYVSCVLGEDVPVPISVGVISIDLLALLKLTYPSAYFLEEEGRCTATFRV